MPGPPRQPRYLLAASLGVVAVLLFLQQLPWPRSKRGLKATILAYGLRRRRALESEAAALKSRDAARLVFQAMLRRRRHRRPATPRVAALERSAFGAYATKETLELVTEVAADDTPQVIMPVSLFVPRGLPRTSTVARPVVVLLHYTSGSAETFEVAAVGEKESLVARFLRQGFAVVTVDSRYHGDRASVSKEALQRAKMPTQRRRYNAALMAALLARWTPLLEAKGAFAWALDFLSSIYLRMADTRHASDVLGCVLDGLAAPWTAREAELPFIYDTVWDLMALGDYLEARGDAVDAGKVYATGVSLGGMHSLAWAFADPRVRGAAPLIGVQQFRFAIEEDVWHARVESIPNVFAMAAELLHDSSERVDAGVVQAVWDTITPGITSLFDAEHMMRGIAPRPLLILNGRDDPRCPSQGVRQALLLARDSLEEEDIDHSAMQLYEQHGVGHEATREMWSRVEAFLQELEPPPASPGHPPSKM